ncbi:MAG TPA: hypothetical protein VGC21_10175 [Telluria sp.]|jgi:hypothetical protein
MIASSSLFFNSLSKPKLRRVRRDEVSIAAFVKPDGLETCLACWKNWMLGDPDKDLGIKTMQGLTGDGDGHGVDSHEAQQAADNRIGAATDAMINSLPRQQVWAIQVSCSISTVWRFPNADLPSVAAEAKDALTVKLKNNICTAVLF